MGEASFILCPVDSTLVIELGLVVKAIPCEILDQVLIQLSTLLGDVNLLEAILPPLEASLLSSVTRYV